MAVTTRTKTVGIQKAMDRIAAYNRSRAKPALERAALAGADVAKRWVEEKMVEPKSGRVYPELPTQPSSAPGEVPAAQSEALIQSLNTRNTDSGSPTIGRAIFGAGAEDQFGFPYALALEFGYGDLAARPYMRPAVDENHDEIAQAMIDAVNAEWHRLNGSVGPGGTPDRASVLSGIASKLG
jgi:hypothetical protein